MEISADAARWFEDYYPVRSSEELDDGWRRVELFSSSDTWSATVALKLGKEARNVEPPSVTDRARELAAAIASRHA
jgi:predicted DNA-binding transcriptional regulator YafY